MAEPKKNYLSVCNNLGVPLNDFQEAFCKRCLQPECELSMAGQSLFEGRVHNWRDRLFKNPKTMPEEDPRYAHISAQKFINVPPVGASIPIVGSSPASQQQSAWIDPLAVEEPKKKPKPRKAAKPKPELVPELVVETEVPPVPELDPASEPLKVEAPPPEPRPQPTRKGPLQTPFQQGAMIQGIEPPAPTPQKDPWAAPAPVEPGTTVVKPGAKIRFGK